MKKYDPTTPEQVLELKDGRTIFKTHNGFRAFMTTADETRPITHEYYKLVKKHAC